MRSFLSIALGLGVLSGLLIVADHASPQAQKKEKAKKEKKAAPPWVAPTLPDGKLVVSDVSPDFIKAPEGVLRAGVTVAKTPPRVDFLYYPCQTYKASIWSNWGDGLAANGKYYSAIGDHKAPEGNAFVYEYDPESKNLRLLVDLRELLQLAMGWYTPGKIHGQLGMGKDGKIYFSTHRGSTTTTTAVYHYTGDWIIGVDPKAAKPKPEIIAHGAVKNHCIPCTVVDKERMIFYGGTAPGSKNDGGVRFLAYDLKNKKVLYDGENGPPRYIMLAKSTGKVYYIPGAENGELVCWDPAKGGAPYKINATIGLRACTEETDDGTIYTVARGGPGNKTMLFAFNTKTEKVTELGEACVASNEYVASMDCDATGRYLYYVPGAHSGAQRDGTPVIQFDTKTKTRKVLCFLAPFYKDKYGGQLVGTYSTAIDAKGDKLFVTWNVDRGVQPHWDCCGMTCIHIPESERQP